MSKEEMKLALEKIATVNAMDYEYQAWAREALAKQEQGEPVAFIEKSQFDLMLTKANLELVQKVDKLLNAQQRTWVGLTEDEMKLIDPDGYADGLPQQIQQALKEKNT